MATEQPPWETIRRAADHLATLASEAATDYPWHAGDVEPVDGKFYGQYGDFGWYVAGPAGTPEFEDSEKGLACARWVATLSPAVAEPLVAWLRAASDFWKLYDRPGMSADDAAKRVGVSERAALNLALRVLGEPS